MKQVLISDFNAYLNGLEVETTVKGTEEIHAGEKVLAFRDSLAATTSLPVPRGKQDMAIGIEGMVTGVITAGDRKTKIKVRKV